MAKPRALVIRAAGTNCDEETVHGFTLAGASTDLLHVRKLLEDPRRLDEYDLIGFPGGFSYGDDIASGRVLAVMLRENLWPALREAAARGACMIGICNGFQSLVQVGLLPGPDEAGRWPETAPRQCVALAENRQARYVDRWARVEPVASSPCVWTRGLLEGGYPKAALTLPVGHGEGRFVADSPDLLARLDERGQIALRYASDDNPNGSEGDVAGICDATGRIFGLMPHPDRFLDWTLHPFWTRLSAETRRGGSPGLAIFRSAVEAVREDPVSAG